jgi:cycloeucalenol cycloisomerase
MYKVGSLFYAIYFFVSFPMFYRMDEEAGKKGYGLWRVVVDALAAGMIVTCLLDFWRLGVGSIYEAPKVATSSGRFGLPWLPF